MDEHVEVYCPACNESFDIVADAMIGEIFECPICGIEVEVVENDPIIEVEIFIEEEK